MTEYAIVKLKRKTVTTEQMKEAERYFKRIEKKPKKLPKVGWGI